MLFSGVFVPTVYPVYPESGRELRREPRSANQNLRRSSVLSNFHFHFSFPFPPSYLDLCPFAPLSREESTLMKHPISVAYKELTGSLSPLDSALSKNKGRGVVMVNQTSHEVSLSRVRRSGEAEGYENCRVYPNNSPSGTLSTEPVQVTTPLRAASARSASPRYPFPLFAFQL